MPTAPAGKTQTELKGTPMPRLFPNHLINLSLVEIDTWTGVERDITWTAKAVNSTWPTREELEREIAIRREQISARYDYKIIEQ